MESDGKAGHQLAISVGAAEFLQPVPILVPVGDVRLAPPFPD